MKITSSADFTRTAQSVATGILNERATLKDVGTTHARCSSAVQEDLAKLRTLDLLAIAESQLKSSEQRAQALVLLEERLAMGRAQLHSIDAPMTRLEARQDKVAPGHWQNLIRFLKLQPQRIDRDWLRNRYRVMSIRELEGIASSESFTDEARSTAAELLSRRFEGSNLDETELEHFEQRALRARAALWMSGLLSSDLLARQVASSTTSVEREVGTKILAERGMDGARPDHWRNVKMLDGRTGVRVIFGVGVRLALGIAAPVLWLVALLLRFYGWFVGANTLLVLCFLIDWMASGVRSLGGVTQIPLALAGPVLIWWSIKFGLWASARSFAWVAGVLWRFPARILLLRPFHNPELIPALADLVRQDIGYCGHVYTLADTVLDASLNSRFDFFLGQRGDAYRFVPRPIDTHERVLDIERQIEETGSRNANWFMSASRLFVISVVDGHWRTLVSRLITRADLVLVDLSESRENILFEIDHVRASGRADCMIYLAHESQQMAAREFLRDHDLPCSERLFAYGDRGLENRPAFLAVARAVCGDGCSNWE